MRDFLASIYRAGIFYGHAAEINQSLALLQLLALALLYPFLSTLYLDYLQFVGYISAPINIIQKSDTVETKINLLIILSLE
jgi:hypothetical protein